MKHQWSSSARAATLRLLTSGEFGFTPDGVAFKHVNGRRGIASISDLLQDIYRVKDRADGTATCYDSAESLIASGWVLD
jgi:hypothetical protein